LDILPDDSNNWTDYLLLLLGISLTGLGGGLYVSGGVGAGPRDGFMLSISERFRLSVVKARIMVELFVLAIGILLGGPVFWVTFIYTLILSPIFQFSLKFFTRLRARVEEKYASSYSA